MGSSCMPAWLFQKVVLTSPVWSPCWGRFPIILSLHTTLTGIQALSSHGGQTRSRHPISAVRSQAHDLSPTEQLFLMPARASESALSSRVNGGHGTLSQDGNVMVATLVGRKQLDSSSSSTPSQQYLNQVSILESTVIIGVSLKGGGKAEVGTREQMRSFANQYCYIYISK